jgi:hypothetical protein
VIPAVGKKAYASSQEAIGTPMLANYLEEALSQFGKSFEDFEENLEPFPRTRLAFFGAS